MKDITLVFEGTYIHAVTTNFVEKSNAKDCDGPLEIITDGLIGVSKGGIIEFVGRINQRSEFENKFGSFEGKLIKLEKKFLIPGFVDTHIHAPQYPNAGTGIDLTLLDWLNKYTFPTEKKYQDLKFASEIYNKVVQRTLQNGTTTACYYASLHLEATKLLVDIVSQKGQRALIGKVCMDRNSPVDYVESTQDNLNNTEKLIIHCQSKNVNLITPIITPRFVPTCTDELMKGLSELAKKYNVPIQSHISENKGEVEWVKELYPNLKNYAQVYDQHGLLNNKTIMAHGIFLTDEELVLFRERKSGLCHCPISNYSLHSGILDVIRALNAGVKVGLGTDISGGYSPSILQNIRAAIIASSTLQFSDDKYIPLGYKEILPFRR